MIHLPVRQAIRYPGYVPAVRDATDKEICIGRVATSQYDLTSIEEMSQIVEALNALAGVDREFVRSGQLRDHLKEQGFVNE